MLWKSALTRFERPLDPQNCPKDGREERLRHLRLLPEFPMPHAGASLIAIFTARIPDTCHEGMPMLLLIVQWTKDIIVKM